MAHTAKSATIAAISAPATPGVLEATTTGRLDAVIWSLIAAAGALVAISVPALGFHLVWESFLRPACAMALLAAAGWFYRCVRQDQRLASALTGTAQIVAFAAVGAPLSYIGSSLSGMFPLQDHAFEMADKALGFDWHALLAWMDAHSALHPIFRTAYSSLTAQASVAILALSFTQRLIWLRVFMLSFVIATLIGIAIAIFVPACDVWCHYGVTALDHPHIQPVAGDLAVPVVQGLRDGSYRQLVAIGSEGIITFPSLHAAFAIILIVAFWPVPVLRWIGLGLNVVMLASTPVEGAHYLVDILAGFAVAAIAIGMARTLASRFSDPSASSC